MAFRTKLDFSSNRQVKQRIETFTHLSGGTIFGLPFSSLPTGPDLRYTGITFSSSTVLSTFSGDSANTIYSWYYPQMSAASSTLLPITPAITGITQEAVGFFPISYTTIDGNTVATAYSGISFDLIISTITDLGGGNYAGSVQSEEVLFLSAGTLDFTGRTIWNDVSGITRTEDFIMTRTPIVGAMLECIDSEGKGSWIPASASTSGLWIAGSGLSSVRLNGGGNTASGNYSVAEGSSTLASGTGSHAEGGSTSATTTNAHAEGRSTRASGLYSHAEGDNTISSGYASHAEGQATSATTTNTHAEGQSTSASGVAAHAEGWSTISSGFATHAEGSGTTASGNYSHAEGFGSIATNDSSHAEGILTTASGIGSHAEGFLSIASNYGAHAEGGSSLSAIKGGTASGIGSHAEGLVTSATTDGAHAEGSTTLASGSASHAEGTNTIASGNNSHAQGFRSLASGECSHAEGGYLTGLISGGTASGIASHAEGGLTIASGFASHAEGQSTQALGGGSHAEGFSTIAVLQFSHVEGFRSLAAGDSSHAEGGYGLGSISGGTASGSGSHAEGGLTIASGDYSHAQGFRSIASGYGSHAEGGAGISSIVSGGTASGAASHAEGVRTLASGDYSHAEGIGTSATTASSHAEGWNTLASNSYAHAEGWTTRATGIASHAGGQASTASGSTSFVHGLNSIAGGTNAVVLGASITGLTNDTTHVDNLNIKTVGAGPGTSIAIDGTGRVVLTASDIRLKENISTLTNSLDKVKNLRGVTFQLKDKVSGGEDFRIGFIAQEVNEIVPELTFINKTIPEEYMGVHYSDITALLVEAVKELASGGTSNEYLQTQTILAEDNNIELNYSGTPTTALGGGLTVLHGMGIDLSSELIIDADGNWTTNNDFIPNKITLPAYTPSGSTDTNGNLGNVTRDDDYLYIRTNTGWKRTNLENF